MRLAAVIGEFRQRATAALESQAIPYMLTGSLASSMYGVPRSTNDIDIVIEPTREQLLALVQLFQRVGLTVHTETALTALRNKTEFNVVDLSRGWKVDLIVRKAREFSDVEFSRKRTHEVQGMRLTLARPEDVILAKLEWAKIGASERQLDDAAGILKMQREVLDLRYVERWVNALDLAEQWRLAHQKAR